MNDPGSVTRWVEGLTSCDTDAAQHLWDHYFLQLASLAKRHLHRKSWGGIDEEDVALSALDSFIARRTKGAYSQLRSRDDIWKLLAMITRRKAINVIRREMAGRRGGLLQAGQDVVLQDIFRAEPTPDQAAEVLDEARRLLEVVLGGREPNLQKIAQGKLQGDHNSEIAERLGVSRRTIERKLEVIRILWEQDMESRDIWMGQENQSL